jgi:hypothetical protein
VVLVYVSFVKGIINPIYGRVYDLVSWTVGTLPAMDAQQGADESRRSVLAYLNALFCLHFGKTAIREFISTMSA